MLLLFIKNDTIYMNTWEFSIFVSIRLSHAFINNIITKKHILKTPTYCYIDDTIP